MPWAFKRAANRAASLISLLDVLLANGSLAWPDSMALRKASSSLMEDVGTGVVTGFCLFVSVDERTSKIKKQTNKKALNKTNEKMVKMVTNDSNSINDQNLYEPILPDC